MAYAYPIEEAHYEHHPRFRHVHPWQLFAGQLLSASSPAPAPRGRRQANHVSWEETAAAHLYSASLPGVKKEEIRVEVEDARYLVIRTELGDDDDGEDGAGDGGGGGRRRFTRKFRLPGMVDADGISAEYTHGVLKVTVPRMHTRARPTVDVLGGGPAHDPVARAA